MEGEGEEEREKERGWEAMERGREEGQVGKRTQGMKENGKQERTRGRRSFCRL